MKAKSKPGWYALYTRSRAEKSVARELAEQHIEHYLPMQKTIRQWSDRKKKVEVPLIRSYVFVRTNMKNKAAILKTPGVVNIVSFCGKPVSIPDWQIGNLKILMGTEVPIINVDRNFEKDNEVEISWGIMKGLRGRVIHVNGKHRMVISITALNYNVSIDIGEAFVETVISDI